MPGNGLILAIFPFFTVHLQNPESFDKFGKELSLRDKLKFSKPYNSFKPDGKDL